MPEMSQSSLFPTTPTEWEVDPIKAFDNWLRSLQTGRLGSAELYSSTADIYRVQWRKFVDFLWERHVRLSRLTATDISLFLEGLPDNRSQRDRYRKLIERALTAMYGGKPPRGFLNPAAVAMKEVGAAWKAVEGNRPTGFLSSTEREMLIAHLLSPISAPDQISRWRELRDRTIVATFLGAGLKVSEAAGLTVSCMPAKGEPWLQVDKKDSRYSHRTMPEPFAVGLLRRWFAERTSGLNEGGTQSTTLFPGQVDGGPMHSVTMLRITEAIVCASGVADVRPERASPQTMRNSFIAGMFESGASTVAVSESLGFALITAERMKVAWSQWKQASERR